MRIENQVVSLELAKKLKELGIKQESIFVWEYYDEQCYGVKYIPYAVVPDSFNKFQLYSAFNVAELMGLLPAFIDIKRNEPFNNFGLHIQKMSALNIQYIARYVSDTIAGENIGNPHYQLQCNMKSFSESLADCLALLLIRLIEEGLFKHE